jgi:uncharacterized protein (DUF3820 family)
MEATVCPGHRGDQLNMPFGKYQGMDLSSVPDSYLEWLTSIEIRQPLLGAVLGEVVERGLDLGHQPATVGWTWGRCRASTGCRG